MDATHQYTIHPRLKDFPNDRESLLKAHPDITDTICGGLVFATNKRKKSQDPTRSDSHHSDIEARVLILQRASTLPENQYPDTWDFPGGRYETTDASLFDAVAREVLEETGLHVSEIVQYVGTVTWTKGPEYGSRKWGKFCFIVNVAEMEGVADPTAIKVVCAPDEHQRHAWATHDEVKDFNFIGSDKGQIVSDAFGSLSELEESAAEV